MIKPMFTAILVNLAGIVTFLFLFWRKLKDDYVSAIIFSSGFYIIFGIVIAYLISSKFAPIWWFWASFLGASFGFTLSAFKFRLNFFETFEAAFLGFLPWLALFFLSDSVVASSPFSLGYFLFICSLIFLSLLLEKNYKTFTWYKSGKVGFVGLGTASLFFLIRATIALFAPFVLSFVGKSEVILSSVISFVLFLLLFNLSRI